MENIITNEQILWHILQAPDFYRYREDSLIAGQTYNSLVPQLNELLTQNIIVVSQVMPQEGPFKLLQIANPFKNDLVIRQMKPVFDAHGQTSLLFAQIR